MSVIEPKLLDISDVFKNHGGLESGEAVDDLLLIKVPHDNYLAFYIEVGVVSSGSEWTQTAIINWQVETGSPKLILKIEEGDLVMAFQGIHWVSETKTAKEDPAKVAKIKQEKAQAREQENARIQAYQRSLVNTKQE
jgi:hypothetical protein